MAIQVHPSYPYPQHDVKINELWSNCFNVNGLLWGMSVSQYSGSAIINEGAFISNGVVVHTGPTSTTVDATMTEPFYLYGHFGFADSLNLPVIGISRTLESGYAPIAIKQDGTWSNLDPVTIKNLKDLPAAHKIDTNSHITSDEYAALVAANDPSLDNLFAKESDTTSLLPVMSDEMKLLPYSLVAGYAIDDMVSSDSTDKTIYESVTSNSVEFLDIGLRELFDIGSMSVKRSDDGYMDNLFSSIVVNADSSNNLHLSRCSVEQQSEVAGLRGQYSHKMAISNACGPARMTWAWTSGLDITSDSDLIYTNIRIPDTTDLTYIELSISDGTSKETLRKELYQLSSTDPNAFALDVSQLDQSSVIYIDLKFQYTNGISSDYFYIDSFAKASTISTLPLTDTTSPITAARISTLIGTGEFIEQPIVDVSIDDGTNYLNNIILDDYNGLGSLPLPSGNYKLKLRFNMMNTGGDFSRTMISWPDQRRGQAMLSDSQADISVLVGGDCNLVAANSTVVFSRPADAIHYGRVNSELGLSFSAHANIGKYFSLIGGRVSNVAQKTNYLMDWATDTISSRQDLVVNASHGGLASCGDNRLLHFMGKDNRGLSTLFEFNIASDAFTSLTSSPASGQTSGRVIGNGLYAASGDSTAATGIKYSKQTESWTALGLNQFTYYSTCARLKSRAIMYESELGSVKNNGLFDHDTQTEKSIQAPLTGAGNSGSAVYYDDAVSFGPYEKDGTYHTAHSMYVPYKSPRLSGFAVKYIT